jgi:hypothetical protein
MDFKIKNEEEIKYPGINNQLWLMLVRVNGSYGVETNTRYESLGRKIAPTEKVARRMFEDVSNKLNELGDLHTATDLLDRAFAMPTINEMMFIIIASYSNIKFPDLCRMKKQFSYKTFPPHEDMIFENNEFGSRIQVIFPNRENSIGAWISAPEALKYEFQFNDKYLK